MRIITQKDKNEINRLYLELGTYAAVSRATGFSPSTVKKYVDPNYVPMSERPIKKFSGELPLFKPTWAISDNWNSMCELSEAEISELKELWEELDF